MYVISVVNLGNCALYLEAQNQEKEFGSWCGFSPRLWFTARWGFAWWGRVYFGGSAFSSPVGTHRRIS